MSARLGWRNCHRCSCEEQAPWSQNFQLKILAPARTDGADLESDGVFLSLSFLSVKTRMFLVVPRRIRSPGVELAPRQPAQASGPRGDTHHGRSWTRACLTCLPLHSASMTEAQNQRGSVKGNFELVSHGDVEQKHTEETPSGACFRSTCRLVYSLRASRRWRLADGRDLPWTQLESGHVCGAHAVTRPLRPLP